MATDLIKKIEKQIVKTDSLFSVDESFNDERFMRVRIAAMHSGINRNNSSFSTDVIKAAKDTFANIPILADVQEYKDEDGNKYLDYSGHSIHIEEDVFNDKNSRIIYDEKVVGIVPESNNFEIITDAETGNDYVYVDALLYREYGNYVCDILESRDNKTDVSMEIGCDDVSYSAKDKCLVVNKMTACAITLLGDHVTPGMAKAHAEAFSMNNNDRQNQLIQIMQELKQSLDNYTVAFATQNSKEGGNDMAKLEKELVNDVNDLDHVVETFSEPEIMDVNADPTSDENANETFEDENVKLNESEEKTEDEVIETEEVKEDKSKEDESKKDEVIEDEEKKKKCKCCEYSVQFGDSDLHQFSVSLNDAVYAISQLVNDTYVDDCTWYSCTVYDNPKEVVMVSWEGKAYKQSYKVKDDVYSLKGDRVEVYNVWMTSDEKKAFEEMKSKYSDISEKLSKYEAEPSKMEILNSEDYRLINESESFAELCKTENHFDMSIDEVRETADKMLNEFAKSCGRNKETTLNFAELNTNAVNKKSLLSEPKKKSSRYGDLF